jgi:hypothetical protein
MTETDIQRYAREIAAVDLTTFDLSHPTTTEYRLAHEVVRLRQALDAARFFAAGWRREAYILNQCWTESIEDVNEVMDNLPYYYHQHLYGVDPALLNTKRKKPHA